MSMMSDRITGDCVIRVGWMIDGAAREAQSDVLIGISEGKIRFIHPENQETPALDKSEPFDFSHCTLLPPFVDCHIHLSMSGTTDPAARQRQLNPTFKEIGSVMRNHLLEHLAHGVIALRDGGDSAGHTLRCKNDGFIPGDHPVILHTCMAWCAENRYGRLIGRHPAKGETLSQSILGAGNLMDHIKIINSGLNSLTRFGWETPPQFSPLDLKTAVETASSMNLSVMVHANGTLPVKQSLNAGCLSIEHGFFMGRDNLHRMRDRQAFWVPTAFSMKAYSQHLKPGSTEADVSGRNLDHQLEQLTIARQIGIQVAIGTDSGGFGLHHGRAFGEEFKLLVEAGFSVEEAVRCACSNGARLLGLEKETGTLRVGMPASFILIRGAPTVLASSLPRPERIVIRGKEIRMGEWVNG